VKTRTAAAVAARRGDPAELVQEVQRLEIRTQRRALRKVEPVKNVTLKKRDRGRDDHVLAKLVTSLAGAPVHSRMDSIGGGPSLDPSRGR